MDLRDILEAAPEEPETAYLPVPVSYNQAWFMQKVYFGTYSEILAYFDHDLLGEESHARAGTALQNMLHELEVIGTHTWLFDRQSLPGNIFQHRRESRERSTKFAFLDELVRALAAEEIQIHIGIVVTEPIQQLLDPFLRSGKKVNVCKFGSDDAGGSSDNVTKPACTVWLLPPDTHNVVIDLPLLEVVFVLDGAPIPRMRQPARVVRLLALHTAEHAALPEAGLDLGQQVAATIVEFPLVTKRDDDGPLLVKEQMDSLRAWIKGRGPWPFPPIPMPGKYSRVNVEYAIQTDGYEAETEAEARQTRKRLKLESLEDETPDGHITSEVDTVRLLKEVACHRALSSRRQMELEALQDQLVSEIRVAKEYQRQSEHAQRRCERLETSSRNATAQATRLGERWMSLISELKATAGNELQARVAELEKLNDELRADVEKARRRADTNASDAGYFQEQYKVASEAARQATLERGELAEEIEKLQSSLVQMQTKLDASPRQLSAEATVEMQRAEIAEMRTQVANLQQALQVSASSKPQEHKRQFRN